MNPIRERTIPGFATYFWFIADRNLMATVKLHNKVTAQATLQKYIQCFLKQSSEHAKAEVIELEDGSHELKVTASRTKGEERSNFEGLRLIMKVKVMLFICILALVSGAGYFGRHITFSIQWPLFEALRTTASIIFAVVELHFAAQQGPGVSTKVKYTLSPDVGLADVNQMILDWDNDPSEVNDYGFVFKGEPSKTYWLSNSLSRTQFDVRIGLLDDEIVNLQSLLVLSLTGPDILKRFTSKQEASKRAANSMLNPKNQN
ncbi:hypothetical protein [Klebsiella quasipneumoniae]|uniref:hypothetical protein n=1 Tax=Klebsiella quasipneumoniae TaxID=1463165 RepID=UPI0022006051|nr:hypothetical protein [Klebsiella quasipneumoniae]BDO04242.1 hypothetical protein KAM622c_38290 [Klebsiella quasipneumoniae subsp. quasipneumoniae]